LGSVNQSSTGNKESIKISDWLDKQRLESQIEPPEETSYKKYYLLLLLLLLAGGATWYYWGDIYPNLPGWPGLPKFPWSKKAGDKIKIDPVKGV
jgi:hypothetical protein